MKILLGYELKTGAAVEIPLEHLAVTGQTQLSGKTTTLEALISRSGLRAVAFVTKRGEGSFQAARTIAPYFKDRADWQFVKSLLESQARARMNFEAAWIVRACKGARSLKDVQTAVQKTMRTSKRAMDQNICEVLNAYLEIVIPQLEALPYTREMRLARGINVIELTGYSAELQALVIRSVLEWVYEREKEIIVIIPEAWEFIPQKRGSPVKLAAEELIRKGGALQNYVWLDSQDIAGVHKDILRSVGVWILGVQREANEVKRALAHIPLESPKPKASDVMTLSRGEFFVSFERELRKVYVQPAWLDAKDARAIARGELPKSFAELRKAAVPQRRVEAGPAAVSKRPKEERHEGTQARGTAAVADPEIEEEDPVWKERFEALERETAALKADNKKLRQMLHEARSRVRTSDGANLTDSLHREAHALLDQGDAAIAKVANNNFEEIYRYVVRRILESPPAGVLELLVERPELRVKTQAKILEIDGTTVQGRVAQLIAEGFFETTPNGNTVFRELLRRGARVNVATSYRALQELCRMGFLTNEGKGKGFRAVPGVKISILEESNP